MLNFKTRALNHVLAVATLVLSLQVSAVAEARFEVLFHPTDPTLEKIGSWLTEAHDTVDIAMYNMDTSKNSPVVQALLDPQMQARLQSGDVTIRMIFEGYGKPADNEKKMQEIEAMGVDVRFMKSSKKVHHKFAVIDSGLTQNARVISGSANWSLSSYRGYDENILFMEQEVEATQSFGSEFQRLWETSEEFGTTQTHPARVLPDASQAPDRLDAFFNSSRVLEKIETPDSVLTSHVVRLIDSAQSELLIATTRVRLQPILESLKAAAGRGVKVKILISQDDYHDLWKREDYLLNVPNIELRVKFYNLRPNQYISAQMHNKFMIVDRKIIETGSFNWSESSDNSHVENLIILKDDGAREVLTSYIDRFDLMFERGRPDLAAFMATLAQQKSAGQLPFCGFSPISMSYSEIRELLKLAPKCQSK